MTDNADLIGYGSAYDHLDDPEGDQMSESKHPRAEVYPDAAGEFRFRVIAANGENLTPESYTRRHDATRGLAALYEALHHPKFEIRHLRDAPDDAVVSGSSGLTGRELREFQAAKDAGATPEELSDLLVRQARERHHD